MGVTQEPETPEPEDKPVSADAELRAMAREISAGARDALSRLDRIAPTRSTSSPARDESLDRAQTRADALSVLRPILSEEARQRFDAKLTRKAMRKLR